MEDAYIITGGNKISGEITLSGSKNVALKTIIASLLFKNKVVIHNVPKIGDILELLHLVEKLGVTTTFSDTNTLEIDPTTLSEKTVDMLHASKLRVSFMLLAPLIHAFGECFIPNPGGCRIGARPIDRIIDAAEQIGVKTEYNHDTGYYKARLTQSVKGSYRFTKSTHTGTEFLILLAVIGDDQVVIENAAQEPEIDELIQFLNQSGANIKKDGKTITIEGVRELRQNEPLMLSSDRNEAVTFAVLAMTSRGKITVGPIDPKLLSVFFDKIREAGGMVEINGDKVTFSAQDGLKAVDVETDIHPGFMTDWQPNWAVLMTQAEGKTTIHERVFEQRFSYVNELKKLGAQIEFIDPQVPNPETYYQFNYDPSKTYSQAIQINGKTKLHAGVLRMNDLRAGATLAIAALITQGESILEGATILDRGYERFDEKIRSLGGAIRKV